MNFIISVEDPDRRIDWRLSVDFRSNRDEIVLDGVELLGGVVWEDKDGLPVGLPESLTARRRVNARLLERFEAEIFEQIHDLLYAELKGD